MDGDLLDLTTNRMFLSVRSPPWASNPLAERIVALPSDLRATCPSNVRLGQILASTSDGLWLVDAHTDELELALLQLNGVTVGGDVDGIVWASSAQKTLVWIRR